MLAAPPWISTNSGYFRVGSKFGGRTIMLWIGGRAELVNQKCSGGCQSSAAALSRGEAVSARCVLLAEVDADDLGGVDRAAPVRRSRPCSVARDAIARFGVDAARRRDGERRLAALRGHGVDLLEAGVFGGQVDLLAVRVNAQLSTERSNVFDRRSTARRTLPGPRRHRETIERVDLLVVGARREVERAAVRAEARMLVRDRPASQLRRLAAAGGT